ncbi:DUF6901 family protein [Pseudomonas leptonychotis]|uniref:Uncharacterized protein n=1 Tax=Pseudomonas leptonychotis TaxID=2448482 RepID=A0A4T1ZZC3_9PSED|nr:hypothetical protein [Pseudomonas leptonychotis]TIH09607.1 hypothetical protein D8779_02590 [Pseudomonas leptonychotis]
MPHVERDRLISYRFTFADGKALEHVVDLQGQVAPAEAAGWTRLDFQQCAHCPLSVEQSSVCPFAAALQQPISMLSSYASFEPVEVLVRWRDREISQTTTLQRAVGSLLGAVGAASGCPHTRLLKAMACFHQPFSGSDETLFRVLGSYLLGQYLRTQHGLAADWDLQGLRTVYRNLRLVNQGMAQRLRSAAEQDSSVNGLVLLDLLAADTLYSLDQYDGQLDRFFSEYLEDELAG